jgi:Uncharacterised nucleotidyltransferase
MDPVDDRPTLAALFAALETRERAAELAGDARALAVARRHRLTPLLWIRCGAHLPRALEEACRRDHVLTVARNLAFASVAEECVAALFAAGVEAALLKGLAYEHTLYERPGSRPTSDVDLLVRDRDRHAAFAVLDALGFEPRAAAPGFDDADYHEVAWRRGGVEIDLHMALAPIARCAIDYERVWRDMRTINLGAARPRVLAPAHAAIFHALHMAIDHFDVPGLYLADLALLLPSADETEAAAETARAWRCERPLRSSLALAAAFQPAWARRQGARATPWPGRRIVAAFGGPALPRPEQLLRKFAHFDSAADALRYTAVQARRNLSELIERRIRRRSPRARLGLARTRPERLPEEKT